jgi:hypothetical protein
MENSDGDLRALEEESYSYLRIIGLIIFNLGMGTLSKTRFSYLVWIAVCIFGNLLIVFLTHYKNNGKS